jgi:hypothetical protein
VERSEDPSKREIELETLESHRLPVNVMCRAAGPPTQIPSIKTDFNAKEHKLVQSKGETQFTSSLTFSYSLGSLNRTLYGLKVQHHRMNICVLSVRVVRIEGIYHYQCTYF